MAKFKVGDRIEVINPDGTLCQKRRYWNYQKHETNRLLSPDSGMMEGK